MPEGKVLTTEGDPGREFFVLIEGTADVRRKGRKVNTMGAGDFFGEIALVSNRPRTATVTATSPLRLLVITDRALPRADAQDAVDPVEGARRARRALRARALDLELEPVVGELDAFADGQLLRAVRDQQPPARPTPRTPTRPRPARDGRAAPAPTPRASPRRGRGRRRAPARPGCRSARSRPSRRASRRRARRGSRTCRSCSAALGTGTSSKPAISFGSPTRYSWISNARSNMSGAPPNWPARLGEVRPPAGRQVQRHGRQLAARPVDRAPHPRHEVAPVVEVEVADRDRVQLRPGHLGAQPREHARPAVEQQTPRPFDAGSRTGRRPDWATPASSRRPSDARAAA